MKSETVLLLWVVAICATWPVISQAAELTEDGGVAADLEGSDDAEIAGGENAGLNPQGNAGAGGMDGDELEMMQQNRDNVMMLDEDDEKDSDYEDPEIAAYSRKQKR